VDNLWITLRYIGVIIKKLIIELCEKIMNWS
jgi:hypothetical protein